MTYLIGEISRITELSNYTLRYYEKEGLIKSIERNSSGLRVFTDDHIELLKIVKCLKDTGMTISNIKKYISLCQDGVDSMKERKNIFQVQKEHIEEEIEKLKGHLETAEYKIWYYENIERLLMEGEQDNCENIREIYAKTQNGDSCE